MFMNFLNYGFALGYIIHTSWAIQVSNYFSLSVCSACIVLEHFLISSHCLHVVQFYILMD